MNRRIRFSPMARLLIPAVLALACAQTPALPTQTAPAAPISPAAPTDSPAIPPTQTPAVLRCLEGAAAPVPAVYQPVYDFLETRLNEKLRAFPAGEGSAERSPFIGAELAAANGNRGKALLLPGALPAVRLSLDRLQALGANAVSIQISDPLLTSLDMDGLAYLEFFRQAVEEAHARNLRVLVETGPVFPDPQYSNVELDWSRLGVEEYFENRKLQSVVIAREIRPDYLSLGNEPETERRLTGLDFSAEDYRTFLARTTAEIGSPEGMLLGGGTGTWEDPSFREAFLQTEGLDFLNVHLYPIAAPRADFLDILLESADLAMAAGRKLIVGESWLYKALPDELAAGISYREVYARDAFSFWQPLDILFLQTMIRIARAEEFEYLSFFWSGYFFGYLDYEQSPADLSPGELVQNLNRLQSLNLQDGAASAVGCAFRDEVQSDAVGGLPPP